MMYVDHVTKSIAWNSVNGTDVDIGQINANVPSYLYQEIPAVFEVIGIFLNITMIIYFIKSKRYQSPVFTILTSLAATDMCCCLAGVVSILTYPTVITPAADVMCGLSVFVILTGILGTEYHLILFAGVRLYQAMSPLNAMVKVTAALMVKYCAIIVVLSIFGGLSYAAYWRSETTSIDGELFTVCLDTSNVVAKDMAVLIFLTIIPCSSIFVIHVLKYFAYSRSKNTVEAQPARQKSPDAQAIVIVITLFYICFFPAMTYMAIQGSRIDGYAHGKDPLYLVLLHVLLSNSIMNPLVYVLAMKSIRDDFIKFFVSAIRNLQCSDIHADLTICKS